jgi:hypothetical protein
MTAEFVPRHHDEEGVDELSEPQEVIYDGANAFIRVAGRWTGFFLGDLGGPRGPHDPLWPLDAPSRWSRALARSCFRPGPSPDFLVSTVLR